MPNIQLRKSYMFQLNAILPFEHALLGFFENPLSKEDLASLIDEKRLDLATSYSALKKQVKSDKEDAVTFGTMLNNLVNNDKVSQQEIGIVFQINNFIRHN